MTERITISVPDEMAEQINDRLSYGDNRSEWIRDAIAQRLDESHESVQQADENTDSRTYDRDDLRAKLRDNLAGSGDLLDRRANQVLAMYEELRDRGAAEKDDLLAVVDVDATGYQDESSVWANMVKGRDTLRALPGVETPATGLTTWRYTDTTNE